MHVHQDDDVVAVVRDALLALARIDAEPDEAVERAWVRGACRALLLDAVDGHGLSSTLHDALVAVGAEPPGRLVEIRRGATVRRLAAARALGPIGRALDGASVPWAVLKGPVVAALHPRPEHREFNDLDILVPGRALGPALDALAAAGIEDLNRNWAGVLTHGVAELPLRCGATWIDFHWHVVGLARTRRELRVDADALIERRRVVPLPTGPVPALDATDQVLHLALHAGLGGAGVLAWLRDLAVVIEYDRPHWPTLCTRAERMGVARLTAHVLDRAARLVGATVPPHAVAALGTGPMLALRRRLDDRSSRRLQDRIAPAFIVKTARDGVRPSLAAVARVGGDRLRTRLGSPRHWDVDDERSPIYWNHRSGGADERDAYLSLAGGP
ncbi:MAG: nucleotidyltransferase family protein [Actinomycetota bacterium]